MFCDYNFGELQFVISDVQAFPLQNMGVDYIIHGASNTSSKAFVEKPVETTLTALNGTKNMLEFARINHSKSFCVSF